MSKLDAMKKLYENRKNEIETIERTTPAEEAARRAEAAVSTSSVNENPEEKKVQTIAKSPEHNNSSNKSKQDNPLDYNYRISDTKCGTTHVSILLTTESASILKTRSAQMGMTQQDYFNMLIEDDKQSEVGLPDRDIMDQINLHGKKSKSITLTVDNFKHMKKAASMMGLNQTNYSNYLILREHKREQIEGKRTGKYD